MDGLSTLPDSKERLTTSETEIIERYFNAGNLAPPSTGVTSSSAEEKTLGWMTALKAAAVVTVLFVALGNSVVISLVDRFPYFGGSTFGNLALRLIIFFVVTLLVFRYLL